ncbi:MFS transporter [Labedaea rhizosphaerae]|uniref:Putative MFS family arabinose efflux permease n=1 Tax=Labedaea rhizosphaerae TaxID=598644 RepID=A0A4R6SHS7_LABRH|nr:MFS transporter [Labedaea rhizosphaerae]TDQ00926.1 putative MFS family arabinose efflux permease [Labedaea rhizosphaerae]
MSAMNHTVNHTVSAERVIRRYNAFQLSAGLLIWLPIFYVYQRSAGLADDRIFTIQSIFYLAFCLLDIPTGALADRFGYRRCLQAGAVVLTAANLVPLWQPTFGGFLLQFLMIALAHSLFSGAGSAYLYEYLHRTGNGEAYQQAEGSARAWTLVGRIVCLPAAGVLMQWWPPSPYLLSAVSCGVAVTIALRLPELPSAGAVARVPVLPALGAALRSLGSAPRLMVLMAQGIAVFTLVRIGQANLFQPILESKSLPLSLFGVVMAATTVFEVAGAARSRLLNRFGPVRVVLVLTVVMAVALAFVVPMGLAGTIGCLALFSLASGLAFPVQRKLVNRAITDPAHRATLLSIESLADRAVCALVVFVMGGFLARGAMASFLVLLAVGVAVAMLLIAALVHRTSDRAAVAEEIPA